MSTSDKHQEHDKSAQMPATSNNMTKPIPVLTFRVLCPRQGPAKSSISLIRFQVYDVIHSKSELQTANMYLSPNRSKENDANYSN